jgi:hypothetical protein
VVVAKNEFGWQLLNFTKILEKTREWQKFRRIRKIKKAGILRLIAFFTPDFLLGRPTR